MRRGQLYSEGIVARTKVYVRDVGQLIKFRLSLLVVFSAAIGYGITVPQADWIQLLLLCLGGFLVAGSANALNEILEKDYDRLMDRTRLRPLPDGRLTVTEGALTAGLMAIGGLAIFLLHFNQLSAILSALALLTYAFVYTPLKRFTPAAVLVGAVPGALPPLIAVVTAAGTFTQGGGLLFLIQFVWQFPHFWAVAWVAHDDYMKAGYHLLPVAKGRCRLSAAWIAVTTFLLVPIGWLPYLWGVCSIASAVVATIAGSAFFIQSLELWKKGSVAAARQLMFGSFLYLPIVQMALLLDR